MEENTSVPSTETTSAEASTEQPAMTEEATPVTPETTYAGGKYKSVGDLENAYTELQSTFSKKMGAFTGAPEAYEFNEGFIADGNEGLSDVLTSWGQENQMSNDGLNSLTEAYNKYQYEQNEAQMAEEFKKLGDDGADRISNVRSYLEANLGKDVTQSLAGNLTSAASIEAIEKLISMSKSPAPANAPATATPDADKIKAMRFAVDEFGQRRMEDPAYRAKVLKLESSLLN